MRTAITPLCMLLAACLGGCSIAAAAPPPPRGADVLDEDRRLDAPVSLRQQRAPLGRVVHDLEQFTGATLKTGNAMAFEPTLIVVDRQPARAVMRQLAELFHLRWNRSESAADSTYELVQGPAAQREEAAMFRQPRDAADEALKVEVGRRAAWVRGSRASVLGEIETLETALERVNELPAKAKAAAENTLRFLELQKRAEALPMLRQAADPLPRVLTRLALAFTDAQWGALARGEVLTFSTRPRGDLQPMPGARARELRSLTVVGPRPPVKGAGDWSSADEYTIAARLERSTGRRVQVSTLQLVPTAIIDGETEPQLVEPPSLAITGTVVRAATAPPASGSAVFPADRRVVAPPAEGSDSRDWRTGLRLRIADTYHLPVVGDAYRVGSQDPEPPTNARPLSLADALDRYVAPHSACTLEGGFLRVRRHRWWEVGHADLRDDVVEEWAAFFRGKSRLSLDETALLARAIRDEQWGELSSRLAALGIRVTGLEDVGANAPVLRMLSGLSPLQKEFVQAGGWLSSQAMTPATRRDAYAALRRRRFNEWVPGPLRTSRPTVLTWGPAEGAPDQATTATPEREPLTITLRHEGREFEYRLALPVVAAEAGK